MNKNYLFFIAVSVTFLLQAQSPITLGNSNMPGSGDTLRYTNVQLASLGNYTPTGTNMTWNFSNVVSTTQGIRQFKSSLQTPYAMFFLSLNEYGEKIADTLGAGPVVITDFYNFYKKQNSPSAFIADGVGLTFSSVPVPSYYSDKDELYNFPMSYPKYDSTSFRFSTLANAAIPVRYSKTGYRVTRVDGWGTITTPYGTANCLRVVTTQYSSDTIKMAMGPVTIPFGFPNVMRSYQWLSTTAKIPVFEISGVLTGTNFTPSQVRYRGYPLNSGVTGLTEKNEEVVAFYPNPVKNALFLKHQGPLQAMEIFDASGKSVFKSTESSLSATKTLDVSGFEGGLYLLKLSATDKVLYYRFIKE